MLNRIIVKLLKLNKLFIKVFKLKITREERPYTSVVFNSSENLNTLFKRQKIYNNELLFVPIEICVWGYGFRYLETENPFIAFLKNKINLFTWYENFQPHTIKEAYFLDEMILSNAKLQSKTSEIFNEVDYEDLPAFIRGRVEIKKSESPFRPSDGIQFHGPASTRKIEWEISRLQTTQRSIEKYGYKPDSLKFTDHIYGQFIKIRSEFRFQILSGRHRAACLANLGIKKLPAKIYPSGGVVPLVSRDFFIDQRLLDITDTLTSDRCIKQRERLINISRIN